MDKCARFQHKSGGGYGSYRLIFPRGDQRDQVIDTNQKNPVFRLNLTKLS